MTDKINDNDEVVKPAQQIAKNIFRVLDGGKAETTVGPATEPEIPQNDYVIVDYDDNQHFATGFLLFTSQHVAVMEEREQGPIPVLVLPLSNVKFAQLYNEAEDVQVELPL